MCARRPLFDVNVLFMLYLPSVALRAQRCSIVLLSTFSKENEVC